MIGVISIAPNALWRHLFGDLLDGDTDQTAFGSIGLSAGLMAEQSMTFGRTSNRVETSGELSANADNRRNPSMVRCEGVLTSRWQTLKHYFIVCLSVPIESTAVGQSISWVTPQQFLFFWYPITELSDNSFTHTPFDWLSDIRQYICLKIRKFFERCGNCHRILHIHQRPEKPVLFGDHILKNFKIDENLKIAWEQHRNDIPLNRIKVFEIRRDSIKTE